MLSGVLGSDDRADALTVSYEEAPMGAAVQEVLAGSGCRETYSDEMFN